MDVYHVSATGTKTNGASTPNDWSDANCYGNVQDALDETADGDHVILDHGDFVVADDIVSTSLAFDGTITIRSRSSDPARTSLKSSSASVGVFRTLNTTNTQNFIVEGITLGKTVVHTGATAAPIWQAAQQTGNLTFRNVVISGVVYNSTRNGAGGVIHMASAVSARTVTLDNVTFEDNEHHSTQNTNFLIAMNPDHILRVLGTVRVRRITASGINFGGFNCRGPIDVQGEIIAEDIEVTGSGSSCAVLKQENDSASCYIRKITGRRLHGVHAQVRAMLLDLEGPFTIGEVYGRDIDCDANIATAGLGGVVVIDQNTGTGTIDLIDALRVRSNYGAAVYLTQGGSATIGRIVADACACFMGTVYKGGDGDLTLFCYESRNLTHRGGVDLLPTEAQPGGLALYSHAHSSADRVCTTTVYHMTTDDPAILPPVHVRNNQGTHAHNLFIYNSVIFGANAADQLVATSSESAAAINCTVSYSAVRGGAAALVNQDATTFNLTTSEIITNPPAFDAEHEPTDPAYFETGRPVVRANHRDAGGRIFRNPPTRGARERRPLERVQSIAA